MRFLVAAVLCFALLPIPAFALGGGTKQKLKAGGYVILMRFTQSHKKDSADPSKFDLNDCNTGSSLDETGRASKMRERFQKAGIKITKALSSRRCRAIDTAKLLAPAVTVEARDELAVVPAVKDPALRRQNVNKLRKEIADWKGPGNLLVVTDKPTIKAISARSLSEGGFLVIDPRTLKIIAEDD